MNILNKAALQGMKKNRTRTIVTIIGVILSSAMITGVVSLAVSLQNYLINGKIQKYGNWHVEFLDVDAAFARERPEDKEVEEAVTIENIGYSMLEGGENPDKPYVFIAGFDEEAFDKLRVRLTSGRLPQNSSEIVVPAHVMTNGGVSISVGDTLSLAVGSRLEGERKLNQHDPYVSGEEEGTEKERFVSAFEKTYTVVGICQRPAFEEYTAPGYTMMTRMDSENTTEKFSTFITLKKPYEVHAYAERVEGKEAYVFNDEVLRFMGFSDDKSFNMMMYSIGGILIALIMLGAVFLIHNSFAISLNDRMRQFGILMSVGATEKQLRNSVLFEGFCIGMIGIPAGILVSIPCIQAVLAVAAVNFENVLTRGIPLRLYVSAPAMAAAAVISMITILYSAYIPAKKAAGTPIMECLRQTNEIKITAESIKTWKMVEYICGLEGMLALKNFKRNRRQYRSIVMSLTLSVVLVVSAGAFGIYLKQATGQEAIMHESYDICFYTKGLDEDKLLQLYEQMKTAVGVSESSYQAVKTYSCTVDTDSLTAACRERAGIESGQKTAELFLDIQFVDEQKFLDVLDELKLPEEEYTGPNAGLIAVAKDMGEKESVNLFSDSAMEIVIAPKDSQAAEAGKEKKIGLTFVDSIPTDMLPKKNSETTPYVFRAVAPYEAMGQFALLGEEMTQGLTFRSENPSQSAREMEAMIADAGVNSEYTLYNIYSLMEQNRNLSFVVKFFVAVFASLISLIGTVNVFNTISTNIRLRRRELAMLRSVGMSDSAFGRMMRFECVLYGVRTLVWSVPIAAIISWLIYKGFVLGGDRGTHFVFPWLGMGFSVLGVFCVIFITMLYAAGRIKRENIVDALRDDLT